MIPRNLDAEALKQARPRRLTLQVHTGIYAINISTARIIITRKK